MTELFRRHRKNSKKGFTLVELIIVIAILAILAAILVPSMIGYINEANTSVGNANARTVYSAAAAAAAVCLASSDATVLATVKTHTITDKAVGELAATGFEAQIAKMLGTDFKGVISVTTDASGAVTTTAWKNAATSPTQTGTYPAAAPAASPST